MLRPEAASRTQLETAWDGLESIAADFEQDLRLRRFSKSLAIRTLFRAAWELLETHNSPTL